MQSSVFYEFCKNLLPKKTALPLVRLDLSHTYLSDESCVLLVKLLRQLKTVELVNLKGNAIDSQGAEEILGLARECTNITKVNLD